MRLPNGYGSIYKLSGNRRRPWCVRKTTGWKDNGQPIYTFIGYYPTRQEALTALADYNKDPYDLQLSSVTFADLYERWSEEHFQKISHSGVNSYSSPCVWWTSNWITCSRPWMTLGRTLPR